MDDNRLLHILAQEPKEDDAIVMILSNFTDYGHSDLGGMISVKQFQKVAEFLIKWREAKAIVEVVKDAPVDEDIVLNMPPKSVRKATLVIEDNGQSDK